MTAYLTAVALWLLWIVAPAIGRRLRSRQPPTRRFVACTMSDGQNYIVVFDEASRWQVRWTFERWMSDPEINMPVEAAQEMNAALEKAGSV